ncbi:MAG TPA: tetratricopeptide repeat protein [Polyangiaceae bacterium]|nr:tetratricopeptide repeat protein [Polyangiaceae bacterium]
MSSRESFEALQNRWASGEPLSEAEERIRRELAALDARSSRELALFAELGARLDASSPPSSAFVQRTLAALRGSRLRLVAPDEAAPAEARTPWLRRQPVLVAGLALLALSGVVLALRTQRAPQRADTSPPNAPSRAAGASLGNTERSELVFASGEVEVGAKAASIGENTLTAGEHVRTRSGYACLTVDPQIDVCLERDSELVLESLAEANVRVRVLGGAVVAALSPRSAQRTFSLVHGEFAATAHGTVFAVAAGSAEAPARISVMEGKVLVSRDRGEARLLGAHASLELGRGRAGMGGVLGRSEEARFYSLLAPRELWQAKNLGVLRIGASASAQRVAVNERGPFPLPLTTFVAAGEHRLSFSPSSGPPVTVDTRVEAGAVQAVAVPDATRKAVPQAEVASKIPSAAALLDEARQKLVHGDARGARESYQRLRASYPASGEATTVLVTLGKLELDLGEPKRAFAAFDTYLKRGGPLAPEALSGKIRALRALGRAAEERAAIEEYLSRHASGFDTPAFRTRLETLTKP